VKAKAEIIDSDTGPPTRDDAAIAGTRRLKDRRRLLDRAMLIGPAAMWLALAWTHRWITDDGLIAARTVRQILAGHGPVFNQGERVEANTSALWTWLIALLSWVTRLDVYTVLLWTGLLLAPAGLLLAQSGTRKLLARQGGGAPRRLVPFGAVIIAALPPFWDFASSGLETSLVFFWLGLCWWLLAGANDGRLPARAAVLGLGWLVRPDLALASAVFLVTLLIMTRPGRARLAAAIACAAALPLGYEVFRMGYYGLLVPNTALVKEASSSNLGQGLTYLTNYANPYALWIPLLMAGTVVWATRPWQDLARGPRLVLLSGVSTGVLLGGYVIWIGGDFMHARMLLPATFTLLLPVMAVPVAEGRKVLAAVNISALLATSAWAAICVVALRQRQKLADIPQSGIVNERRFWIERTATAHPTTPGPYIKMATGTADPREALARITTQAGPVAGPSLYFPAADGRLTALPLGRPGTIALPGDLLGTLGAFVPLDGIAIDPHALSYAVGSHLDANSTRVGHQKTTSVAWIVADYGGPGGGVNGDEYGDGDGLGAARKALACGEFAVLNRATRGPLSISQFFRNVVHASTLTGFRAPNDPGQAVTKMCR
jgi:arabinofuranosyltransferase